jgi:hypothetical protein
MSDNSKPAAEGAVSIAARENVALIEATKTAIATGGTAALTSALYAGLCFAALVYLAPEGKAIKREDARALLGAGIKRSKEANDDFVERTLTSGTALARWLHKNKEVYVQTMTRNSLELGVAYLAEYLSTNHGIRDRAAINKFLSGGTGAVTKTDPAVLLANRIAKGIPDFSPAKFGELLVKALSAEQQAAFAKAWGEQYQQVLKLRADAAAALAAQELDGEAPAFSQAG